MMDFGYFKDEKLFLKAVLSYPDREIGEIKISEEDTVKYFEGRFDQFSLEVDKLQEKIDQSENKGSHIMKVKYLLSQIGEVKVLGDLVVIEERLQGMAEVIEQQISANRVKNTEIKIAILEDIDVVIDAKNWVEGIERVKELQQNWIKTGRVEADKEKSLEESFSTKTQQFFDERKLYFEEKQELIEGRVENYQFLVEKAIALKPDALKSDFVDLKKQWKTIGGVPAEIYQEKLSAFNQALAKEDTASSKDVFSKGISSQTVQRKDLLDELLKLSETEIDAKELRTLQGNFSSLRARYNVEDKKIAKSFYTQCDKLHELSFVHYQLQKQSVSKDDKEAYQTEMIKFLRKCVRRDKDELVTLEDNMDKMLVFSTGETAKLFEGQLRLKQRKLQAKETLLKELSVKK